MSLEIVYLPPGDLTPYEGNTRKHAPEDVEQIKASIEADGDWLFPSRTPTAGGNPAHITRQQAYLDMQEIQRICKVRQRIGCHTMRKTFGYHYYQRTHDLASLQTWFYHENPSTTLIYCGISYDNLARMVDRSPFRLAEGELVDPDGDVQNV